MRMLFLLSVIKMHYFYRTVNYGNS